MFLARRNEDDLRSEKREREREIFLRVKYLNISFSFFYKKKKEKKVFKHNTDVIDFPVLTFPISIKLIK